MHSIHFALLSALLFPLVFCNAEKIIFSPSALALPSDLASDSLILDLNSISRTVIQINTSSQTQLKLYIQNLSQAVEVRVCWTASEFLAISIIPCESRQSCVLVTIKDDAVMARGKIRNEMATIHVIAEKVYAGVIPESTLPVIAWITVLLIGSPWLIKAVFSHLDIS